MAKKFGQGVKTGIQLPAETSGRFPAPSTWSVSTFGNLPIGQGVSYNLVELASMYQAIANGGVRIAPTIVASTTVDGQTNPTPAGATTQVMSAATARTLLDMLRGTMQGGDTNHRGTAPAGRHHRLPGRRQDRHRAEGRRRTPTSTRRPRSPRPSPASSRPTTPSTSMAIMLDDPKGDSPAGTTSCAPLFHDIAAYAMRAADVPPSATEAPIYDLYVD